MTSNTSSTSHTSNTSNTSNISNIAEGLDLEQNEKKIQKKYISAQELLIWSNKLAQNVMFDGFIPTFIIGVWRGGAPVGITVQEFFKYFGIKTDHISIRTKSYVGMTQSTINVDAIEYIVEHANANDKVLLVDDIFDSGRSIKAVLDELKKRMRNNFPQDIRIATVLYKPKNNKTDIVPNYYVETTEEWVIFPHELEHMSLNEIKYAKGEEIAKIISDTCDKLKEQ